MGRWGAPRVDSCSGTTSPPRASSSGQWEEGLSGAEQVEIATLLPASPRSPDQTKGGQGPRPWKRGCRKGLNPDFRGDWGTDCGGSALGLLVLFFSQVTASLIAYCLYT